LPTCRGKNIPRDLRSPKREVWLAPTSLTGAHRRAESSQAESATLPASNRVCCSLVNPLSRLPSITVCDLLCLAPLFRYFGSRSAQRNVLAFTVNFKGGISHVVFLTVFYPRFAERRSIRLVTVNLNFSVAIRF